MERGIRILSVSTLTIIIPYPLDLRMGWWDDRRYYECNISFQIGNIIQNVESWASYHVPNVFFP